VVPWAFEVAVVGAGVAAVLPFDDVIDFAVIGSDLTPWAGAGAVPGFDHVTQCSGGEADSAPVVQDHRR
jgi:hypothetical protein